MLLVWLLMLLMLSHQFYLFFKKQNVIKNLTRLLKTSKLRLFYIIIMINM